MQNVLFIFGTKNFNNSLHEVKEYFNYSLTFFDSNTFSQQSISKINFILVDSDVCVNLQVLDTINQIKNKSILLLARENFSNVNQVAYTELITLPSSVTEIFSKIKNLIISQKFDRNSSLKIREYIVDKNERTLKKNNLSITITEREIELIELLFNEQKPLSKNIILKKVWKYSEDADTHTIETHIYRLRKKILNKFKDEQFITNSKAGYSI